MKTKNNQLEFTNLSAEEIHEINGGIIDPVSLAIIGIAVGYVCWAASFCYQLGKD